MSKYEREDKPYIGKFHFALIAFFGILFAVAIWYIGRLSAIYRDIEYPIPPIKCENSNHCAEFELRIQSREAVTSDNVYDLSIFQAALGAAGLVGVGLTAFCAYGAWEQATRSANVASKQLDAAMRQVKAAEDQVIEARNQVKISRDGQRSYIFVRPTLIKGGDWYDRQLPLEAYARIDNFGSTPAVLRSMLFVVTVSNEIPRIELNKYSVNNNKTESYLVSLNTDIPLEQLKDARISADIKPTILHDVVPAGGTITDLKAESCRQRIRRRDWEPPEYEAYYYNFSDLVRIERALFRVLDGFNMRMFSETHL
jgi:hypothetical protein